MEMSKAEYFAVFESLLYGLALAHILVSISQVIVNREKIKLYWLHIILVIAAILGMIQRYYSGYHGSEYEHVNTAWEFFFLIFLPMGLYFILAYQMFPKKIEEADFKDFFWKSHKGIILTFIAVAVVLVGRNIAIDMYSIEEGRLDRDSYFSSAEFLVFSLGILELAVLGGLAVALKKRSLVKLVSVITFLYSLYIMSTT